MEGAGEKQGFQMSPPHPPDTSCEAMTGYLAPADPGQFLLISDNASRLPLA